MALNVDTLGTMIHPPRSTEREDATWAWGVVVEPRYIEDIVIGIQTDGLEVA